MAVYTKDLMKTPTAIICKNLPFKDIVPWFIVNSIFMFEKRAQRLLSNCTLVYILIVSPAFIYFGVPSSDITFTPNEMRLRNSINVVVTIVCMYFGMEYISKSNLVFDTIKGYSEEVEQQSKEKENFFACMSHEIRNPIQSLMGALELMLPPKEETSKN